MHRSLEAAFDRVDVLRRRDHPDLSAVIDRSLRLGDIESVLPGVYAPMDHKTFPEVRVKALQLYEPAALLVESAAARLSFWPEVDVDDVAAVVPRKLAPRAGYRFLRRRVPDHLVTEIDGVRMTMPALTAIDLGADAIDHGLRTGAVTLEEMREALSAIRWQPGNGARRLVLEESSGQPWSAAERRLHRLLRKAGIEGWRANVSLIPAGVTYVVDVAFTAHRLILEVDGRHFHGEATFEYDRWRQNALVLDGWRVLRFTWTMIETYPERVVDTVQKALAPR